MISPKKWWEYQHVRRRAYERFGITIEMADVDELRRRINANETVPVPLDLHKRKGHASTIHELYFKGVRMWVVYTKVRKRIKTVLVPAIPGPLTPQIVSSWGE